MGLVILNEAGQYEAIDGGPYQYTPEGFNTGLATSSVPLTAWGGGGGSYRQIYETQPWVAMAVNKLTRQVSRVPLKVYVGDSGSGKERVTDGSLVGAIKRPAPGYGASHLKQWLTLPALLHGNSVTEKVRNREGRLAGFRPLNWRHITPRWIDDDPELAIDYWLYQPASGRRIIQPRDVIHIAWSPPAGWIGVSPLKQLGVTLRIEAATQLWQEALMRNSARPSGGLTMPEIAAGDTKAARQLRRELRNDVERLLQGPPNAGRPVLLPPGADWKAFSYNASEAELIEQRKLGHIEVAGVYEMPPPMLGILDDASFSNIETQHRMLYSDALGPWFTLEEQTFSAALVDEADHNGEWVEYDTKELLRGDPVKQAIAEKTRIRTGTLTIDEARDDDNRPRFGGAASQPLIESSNLEPLENLERDADELDPETEPSEEDT